MPYGARGLVYAQIDSTEKAFQDFNKRIMLSPNDTNGLYNKGQVYYNRGVLYYNKKQYEKAAEDFFNATKMTDYNSLKSDAIYMAGMAKINSAQVGKGYELIKDAIQLNDQNQMALEEKKKLERFFEYAKVDLSEVYKIDSIHSNENESLFLVWTNDGVLKMLIGQDSTQSILENDDIQIRKVNNLDSIKFDN